MSELKEWTASEIEEYDDARLELAEDGKIDCTRVYIKSEADKVIAELKMKLAAAQQVLRLNEPEALYSNLETMGRLSHEIDVVARRERKLKRALWLARAERAKETQFLWEVYYHCDKLYFCKPFYVTTRKNPYRYINRMNVVEWDEFWEKIKNKCLAKAEECKWELKNLKEDK